jgi:hypothetical protein
MTRRVRSPHPIEEGGESADDHPAQELEPTFMAK